jgi:hypothetical protein
VPDRDNTLKVLPAPEAKSLRSRENEAAQQFKYVEELCAELELAVLVGNVREVKCQRRALTSGLRQAEEAIVRTAEAHRWTKAELDRALDDVRGHALPHKEQEKAGRKRRSRRPGQNSEAVEMRASPWRRPCRSVLRTCGWKGTAQVQEDRRRRDRDHLGASRRKDPPRVRR